ncbi:MAG: esterase-like activity of phytase family protein [Methylococcales bacterium]|nr:esterase-like activity of phytase family protein [Methylococcales bacterium]
MKKNHSIIVGVLFCFNTMTAANAQSPSANEQAISASNTIFNWAEQNYYNYFPNHDSVFPINSKTILHEAGWIYRYYQSSNNYVGVYKNDVYVAGASFSTGGGLNPVKVFSVPEATNQVNLAVSYADKVAKIGAELPSRVMHQDVINFDMKNGGYGSAATAHPSNKNQFYALTDRGPKASFKGNEGKGKIFPFPGFSPQIGLFQINPDGKVSWVKDIILKDPQGNAITGLPNSSELGGTGETPYDINGNVLRDQSGQIKVDDFGLDGEGLVALKDGTFWVSDEYGPHIVHFDANGREIARINPFKHDQRASLNLPFELSSRDKNHGMEGLTITPDQKTLVGIMQSTLRNPSKKVDDSKLTRIVTINLETGSIGQYLYKQDKKQKSNCEIEALSATKFLVVERDAKFLNGSADKEPSKKALKLIYKIDLKTATNLEEFPLTNGFSQHETLGLTIEGKSLEEYVFNKSWSDLEGKGIKPVQKELLVDMVKEVGYPHDKMEGLWVIDAHTIGILNDDDFSSTYIGGNWGKKYINAEKTKIDTNTLYIIKNLNLN